jgi:hypothetical protein
VRAKRNKRDTNRQGYDPILKKTQKTLPEYSRSDKYFQQSSMIQNQKQKSVVYLYTNSELAEKQVRKQFHSQ